MGERAPSNFVGMPAAIALDRFGEVIYDAFGDHPYLVGSATQRKDWRDVDVRLILADEDFDALFGDPVARHIGGNAPGRWSAICQAFSALAHAMTGLPVDFQIQRRSHANRKWSGEPRIPLFIYGGGRG